MFDDQNHEIIEVSEQSQWVDKIVAISRIQSVTEKYIRMHYSHDRVIYWEYSGGLRKFEQALQSGQLIANAVK